jgi:DNA-binding beta-propeller fold protein YncE
MDPESSPVPRGPETAAGELTGTLREVVEQVRAVPAPPDAAARAVERAAALSRGGRVAPGTVEGRTRATRRTVAVAAVLGLIALLAAVAYRAGSGGPPDQDPVAAVPTDPEGPPSDPKQETRPVAGKSHRAGASPIPFHAVAADAPVLVSTGGGRPIRLGDRQPYVPDGTIHVWDWGKGEVSRPLKVASGANMAVSPDGRWIVTGDGRLIDAATGVAKRLDDIGGAVRGLRVSPDGRALLLTVGRENHVATARVLDFPSGKTRFEVDGQWWATFACVFTPDGTQFFLVDEDRLVRRRDANTGKELGRYEPALTNSVRAIAVSPDGKRVAAAGTRGDIHVWELGGRRLCTLAAGGQPDATALTDSDSLAFSPDGKHLAGGGVMRLVIWKADTGESVRLFPPGSGGAAHVRFSKDGTAVTTVHQFSGTTSDAGDDLLVYPAVRHWDVASGKELESAP